MFKKIKFKQIYKKRPSETILIHIGKCGGSTVRSELAKGGFKYVKKHVQRIDFDQHKKYIIVIRNPIERFVSAFNWRYKLVVSEQIQPDRFEGEKILLEKYKTANNLAENIYNQTGEQHLDFRKPENYIHHITEDIDFHIGKFLSQCKRENIIAVLATETLKKDLKNHFDIELESHYRKNKIKTDLSNMAVNNLVNYLRKDFACIERLNDLNLLSREQFTALSRTNFQ